MIDRWKLSGATLAAALLVCGCNQKNEVQKEIQDLKSAEQNSPQEAAELEKQLQQAKGEVVNLEEKLALAKQGVTDDVLKEREDLKKALSEKGQEVKEEINEAQGKAQALNNDTERAQAELQRVQTAQRVQTNLKTETRVVPSEQATQVETQAQQVPIEQNKLVERPAQQNAAPKTTTTTTTGKPMESERPAR